MEPKSKAALPTDRELFIAGMVENAPLKETDEINQQKDNSPTVINALSLQRLVAGEAYDGSSNLGAHTPSTYNLQIAYNRLNIQGGSSWTNRNGMGAAYGYAQTCINAARARKGPVEGRNKGGQVL
jgi:hypothetical protein